MDSTNLDISNIETYLYGIIKNKVSKNVYVGTLPETTKKDVSDMVLIDCSNINDYDAYGNGVVLVYLYARPKSDGSKNVPLLKKMGLKIDEVIKESLDSRYTIKRRFTYQDYDNSRKWHYNVVELQIIIV